MKVIRKFVSLIIAILLLLACKNNGVDNSQFQNVDYRQEMRDFIQKISQHAKGTSPDFIVIPQNGQEILTQNGESDGLLVMDYLTAIDGAGREDLFYGYDADNQPTPDAESAYMIAFCDICEANGVEVLTIDYCDSHDKMDDSYARNQTKGYISFAAPERDLNVIPDYPVQPFYADDSDIAILSDARNFLYLINPENFAAKQDFINAVSNTDYDLIIMDCFFRESEYTGGEIAQLKTKRSGGDRLVFSYMSIGEAEDYRYYWQTDWNDHPPEWLEVENPDWEGNYKVRYWYEAWQGIICGQNDSYLSKILGAGFDGVYLDIIDAFEYFEEMKNR
jgi:cysteinyl-tRNA synthetase